MIPVVDISKYQGKTDFRLMRSRGVQGVICRAGNGIVSDLSFNGYVHDAQAAGLKTGAYWFCNPQVGTPELQGAMLAESHTRAGCELPPMLDVESFANETKTLPAPGPTAYARWLHVMADTVERRARRPFFYSNRAFWDPNVGDKTFGGYDIIVARYPFYSPAACAAHVPPVNAQDWDEWIMAETSARPQVPTGWSTWGGWQFSAGYNGRGHIYGVSSTDLDLNIIRDDVWERWLNIPTPGPLPHPSEDMPMIVTNSQSRVNEFDGQTYEPYKFVFVVEEGGFLRHVDGRLPEGACYTISSSTPAFTNSDLDRWPKYSAAIEGEPGESGPMTLTGTISSIPGSFTITSS